MENVTTRSVWSNPIHFIAFGFGSGLSKWFPGTCGTLMAIPGYLILQHLSTPLYLAVLAIAFVAGIWICDVTEKAIGIPDYPGIVWDEIVGYWVTMFLVPPGWQWLFLGFILFRFFDILKPWPISWLNKNVHGGFGVMVDDLLAAVISFLVLHLIMYFIA